MNNVLNEEEARNICLNCEIVFYDHPNADRKYCSHKCAQIGVDYFKDEKGNKHGKLTAIKRDKGRTNKNGLTYWICECECGNKTSVAGAYLRNGDVKSCGCESRKNGVPVIKYSKSGEKLKEYSSMTEAAKDVDGNRIAISNACAGRIKTSAGFIWKKKD